MSKRERWDAWLDGLQERYGQRRIVMLALLIVAGIASVMIQLLIRTHYDHTALLYVAVPYTVAVLITLLRPYRAPDRWWQSYISHSVSALVVFLATSVVLFEGFICVLFFMPIYFLLVSLVFITNWLVVLWDSRKSRTCAVAIPLLVGALSMEGTSDVTTFDRRASATATVTTALPADAVLGNLATPFDLPPADHWMLGLFPMPYEIEAGSLNPGDVHRVHTRYHRWFVTNTHEGEIALRIDSVSPDRITASFVRDTSYFSTYVTLIGSEIELGTNDNGMTQVSLTIRYERRLDPAWYFRPVQQHAMEAMAAYLIEEVMIRD